MYSGRIWLTLQHGPLGFKFMFWSHEDICDFFENQADARERECFYAIDSDYGAARADFFRYNVLKRFGCIWADHKTSMSLKGGWTEMLARLPHPTPPVIFATWGGKQNLWGGQLDSSDLLKRGEICIGFLCSAPGHPIMEAVVKGICANIEAYGAKWNRHGPIKSGRDATVGKEAVLRLTGPLAFSEIVYKMLHLHSNLLVDGFGKLGIDFYAIKTYKELENQNASSVGSGRPHYSTLTTRIVREKHEPDYRWNKKGAKRPLVRLRGSILMAVPRQE